MDLYNTIESVGKVAFGIASLGLVAYLIKLLTEINRNQKEHNLLIKDQFQEREKTRDQQIDFLKLHHEKEADLIRMRADSMIAGMESEKRILEQRILLLQEKMRLESPDDTPSLPAKSAGAAQQDSKQSPGQDIPRQAIEAMQVISLHSAHSLKHSLIILSGGLEALMSKEEIGKDDIGKLLEEVRRVDAISHLLASTSDFAVSHSRSVSASSILERTLVHLAPRLSVSVDVPGTLPRVLADPLLLEQAFTELIRNAEVHAASPQLSVQARVGENRIHVRFSNDISPYTSQEAPGDRIGLFVLGSMLRLVGGDLKVTSEGEPARRFTAEVSLLRAPD